LGDHGLDDPARFVALHPGGIGHGSDRLACGPGGPDSGFLRTARFSGRLLGATHAPLMTGHGEAREIFRCRTNHPLLAGKKRVLTSFLVYLIPLFDTFLYYENFNDAHPPWDFIQ
jgi:hypothetical protein